MRADKDVVMEAVKNKGIIVKYASKKLKEDKDIAIEAIKQNKKAFEFLGENIKKNEEVLQLYDSL